MVDMVRKQILPAVGRYEQSLVETALGKRQLNSGLPCARETKTVEVLSGAADAMELDASELEKLLENAHEISDVTEQAKLLKEKVLPQMEKRRAVHRGRILAVPVLYKTVVQRIKFALSIRPSKKPDRIYSCRAFYCFFKMRKSAEVLKGMLHEQTDWNPVMSVL